MIKKPTFPTLNLLRYDTFVAELSRRNVNEVHLESGTRDENCGAPGPWRNYIFVLTGASAEFGISEVLACTFRVRGCWEMSADRHPGCSSNLAKAVEILTTALQADGMAALPGLYAHETNCGYAHPSGLWRFRKDGEKHVLVLGTVPREPSDFISQRVPMAEVTQ